MFRVVSRRSRERDSHTARVQKVAMRPFASPIRKPTRFQIRNELSNLSRHIKLASKKQLHSNAKLLKFVALSRARPRAHTKRTMDGYNFVIGHSCFVIALIRVIRGFLPIQTFRALTLQPFNDSTAGFRRNTEPSLTASYEGQIRELWGKALIQKREQRIAREWDCKIHRTDRSKGIYEIV
jgi:hypothetical protein